MAEAKRVPSRSYRVDTSTTGRSCMTVGRGVDQESGGVRGLGCQSLATRRSPAGFRLGRSSRPVQRTFRQRRRRPGRRAGPKAWRPAFVLRLVGRRSGTRCGVIAHRLLNSLHPRHVVEEATTGGLVRSRSCAVSGAVRTCAPSLAAPALDLATAAELMVWLSHPAMGRSPAPGGGPRR